MSGLLLPDGSTMQVFGEGGGAQVAERLTRAMGADVPLLGQIPLDPALVAAGDAGVPVVLSAPDSPSGKELRERRRRLVGATPRIGRHVTGIGHQPTLSCEPRFVSRRD